jgi:hypothetical protein
VLNRTATWPNPNSKHHRELRKFRHIQELLHSRAVKVQPGLSAEAACIAFDRPVVWIYRSLP